MQLFGQFAGCILQSFSAKLKIYKNQAPNWTIIGSSHLACDTSTCRKCVPAANTNEVQPIKRLNFVVRQKLRPRACKQKGMVPSSTGLILGNESTPTIETIERK
jgi:hypothetical protein